MEEIGRRLRAAREEKEISLQTAEDETRIRRKYLEALENDREADLPGEAYLKGFLRTYGNFLGLDGPALVEEYKASRNAATSGPEAGHDHRAAHLEQQARDAVAVAAERPEPAAPQPAPRPTPLPVKTATTPPARRKPNASLPPAAVAGRSQTVERPRRRSGGWIYSRQAGWTLLTILALAALWFVGTRIVVPMLKPKPPAVATNTPPPTQTVATQPTPPPPTPTPTPQPEPLKVDMSKGTGDKSNEVTFTVPAKEIQLRVEPSTDRVWYEATVDGKIVFSETTTEAHDFKGSSIKLHMGHMDGVSLVINGVRIDKPLEHGPWWLFFNTK